MKSIRVNSYAKINLSIDVIRRLENGYHEVDMVMQQIDLHDEVLLRWFEDKNANDLEIQLKTNKYYLPIDQRNLAYKAAILMKEYFGENIKGTLKIDILKNIPVAAGMAGGSSNGAAVIHGINVLWGLNKDLKELCKVASILGSDVPFTLMGQAKVNKSLGKEMNNHKLATCCALATGTGTQLESLPSFEADILLSKPPISVSTAEVYKGMNLAKLEKRPNNKQLIVGLRNKDINKITDNMINVLEQYTLKKYDVVNETKEKMKTLCPNSKVLMSGSGPTIFGVMANKQEMDKGYEKLKKINKETFKTRTLI